MARRTACGLLALMALLVACGGPSPGAERAADGDREAETVTIEHRYGHTEVDGAAERIVTVGLTDHDALLALGVVPVGTTEWYGGHPSAVWPWAQDELGDAEPVVVGDATEIDLEQVAALDPDLILGLYSALTEREYALLSEIAPLVAQPADHVDYGVPWQELTRIAGQAIGRAERAEELVADVEERVARVRDDHPELGGASVAVAAAYDGVYVYAPDMANVRLLRDLGLEVPAEIGELVGDADGANLSMERIELLDVDVMVWVDAVPDEGPPAEPVWTSLPVHREGREVYLDSTGELGAASFVSVLSVPYLLDRLVPMLEAAVDGDPATAVPAP